MNRFSKILVTAFMGAAMLFSGPAAHARERFDLGTAPSSGVKMALYRPTHSTHTFRSASRADVSLWREKP